MCIDPTENIWSLWCSTSILNAKIYYLSGFFSGEKSHHAKSGALHLPASAQQVS